MSDRTARQVAEDVFTIESAAVKNLISQLTDDFEKAIDAILNTSGKLIVSGMGKSGTIGKKIAASLASTGTPSFFLHPGEAYHGDLGMIEPDDIVFLISYSGETDEVLKIIPFLKSQKNVTISMSGNPQSTLAKNTDFHLNVYVEKEACPLQLAPTSSTTATLAMGDAITVALMDAKNFQDKDFACFHPGGSLGKRLLTKVEDVMKTKNLPVCSRDADIKTIINIVSSGKCGLVVIYEDEKIAGIITDGDIRRSMEANETNFFNLKATDLMTASPKKIHKDERITVASDMMSSSKISSLLVVDDAERFVGIVQVYDVRF